MNLNIPCGAVLDGGERCPSPAVMLIVMTQDDDCVSQSCTCIASPFIAYGYCAGHAPEQVHETRGWARDDEFRVVNLNPVLVTPETVIPQPSTDDDMPECGHIGGAS